jgi:Tol biopolymer transport system component
MSISWKLKLLLVIALVGALFAVPVAAQATVSYVKYGHYPFSPQVFAANDDGGGAHSVGAGRKPQVSPDGDVIAYQSEDRFGGRERLKTVLASGGVSTQQMAAAVISWVTWSPDSSTLAAVRGPVKGPQWLVVIDVPTRRQRIIASGYFSGVSFSPDGTQLAFSRSHSPRPFARTDIFQVPISGGRRHRLTRNHRSKAPLWGPNGEIVFVKRIGGKRRGHRVLNELFVMDANGRHKHRLTHTRVHPGQQGLFPIDWSDDGRRLLAEFRGREMDYSVLVNTRTGGQRPVRRPRENGFVGTAISSAGDEVLGSVGSLDPLARHRVVTVPAHGGGMRVLADRAYEPDWNHR